MSASDVSLSTSTHREQGYANSKADIIISADTDSKAVDVEISDLILATLKVSRNIFENMRKFVQYQLTAALNLIIYIFIGQLMFTSLPIPPFMILLMN